MVCLANIAGNARKESEGMEMTYTIGALICFGMAIINFWFAYSGRGRWWNAAVGGFCTGVGIFILINGVLNT